MWTKNISCTFKKTETNSYNLHLCCASPAPPCIEHGGGVPLRLWPHPQSNGQPDAAGRERRVGTFARSPNRRGRQRAWGPQHRLLGRLQRDSAQGLLRPHCICSLSWAFPSRTMQAVLPAACTTRITSPPDFIGRSHIKAVSSPSTKPT